MAAKLSKTLLKAAKINKYVQTHPGCRQQEISRALGIPTPTLSRLLATQTYLKQIRMVGYRYYPQSTNPWSVRAEWQIAALLAPLVRSVDLPAYLGVVDDQQIVISQIVPRPGHPDDLSKLGERLPVNLSAIGLCWTAFQEELQCRKLLTAVSQTGGTSHTLRDHEDIMQALRVIRQQGYALDDEERAVNLRCLAVPILYQGRAIAVLGMHH